MFATEHQTEEIPKPLADIIREETNDGRHIVRFLIDVMKGQIDESKPCHRLDAARQLLNLGFNGAQSVIQSVSQSASVRAPSPAPSNSSINQELADIIKLETSDGKDAVRFLVDVMQGNLQDFKPHHRIAAAKELLRRGFDNNPGHSDDGDYEYEDHDESFDDDDPRTPEQRDPSSPNYVIPSGRLHNEEDDPFDFDNYDREQFWRDGWGGRALRHIYGSKEAAKVAHKAVAEHRRKTMFDESHIPDRDYTPIDNPEDDPYGKGHYGYNAIRFVFGDNQAIRAANKAVEEYKKRKAEHSGGESENERPAVDRPSNSYPQPTAPSSSEEDDTMPPDHWSVKYLERIRIRSTETDESSKDPDPDESEPIQPPENPYTSESRPDQPPENSDGAGPEPHQSSKDPDPPLSVILERSEESPAPSSPPRKRPVKIFTGPPDESPRQCRDPGGFQAAVDSVWSSATF